jgi:hypothetical protein
VANDEFLGQRKHALEEAFFRKVEKQRLEQLRATLREKSERADLARATGVDDAEVLDALVGLGVSAETLTALALAPLLRVAWADGTLQPGERDAILQSARARGVAEDGPAHALLSSWLDHPPDAALDDAWAAYTQALGRKMTPAQRTALREQVVGFARDVAHAAGGFLGIHTIAAAEEAALTAIAAAFG